MVLHPLDRDESHKRCVPAWEAVARSQKQPSREWKLIAQPDHADLAGDLAERICWEFFPAVDDDVAQGIRLHDEGWAEFDSSPIVRSGRPCSFLDLGPGEFLKAWRGSISRAEQSSAIGGLLVSFHFRRLAEFRLQTTADAPADRAAVEEFLGEEQARETNLAAKQSRGQEEIQRLVDALQFCDLLSLYLCCGSREEVEFPQRFQGHTIRAGVENGLYRTQPSLFGKGTSLGVRARGYPASDTSITLPFLLA